MLLFLKHSIHLIRLNKPVGTFLILWPTLTALWLAQGHWVGWRLFLIFVLGTLVMRSAGCIVNDIADRHIDKQVRRTKHRPITAGHVSVVQALIFLAILCVIALGLVLLLNRLCLLVAIAGLALTVLYPFTKRWLDAPQCILGVTFATSVLIAFAAVQNALPALAWWYFLVALLWPIAYDTLYAMADIDDDRRIGVKSTAILFGRYDKAIIVFLECAILGLLTGIGLWQKLYLPYYIGLMGAGALFVYQYWLIKERVPDRCLAAFLNNQWALFLVFAGVVFGVG
jgi:4-hydroxybenzoate polyprenyltransferase